jgi:di/tripeptidase
MVFGVFPGKTNAEMRCRIENALSQDAALAGKYNIEYIYDVEAGVTDLNDPLVTDLQKAMKGAGLCGEVKTFNAACDIGFYRNMLGVPAVNVGIGGLNTHSMHECADVSDVLKLARAISDWLLLRAGCCR